MKEYRIEKLPLLLELELTELDVSIVEEEFKNKIGWLLYSTRNLDTLLSSFNLTFEVSKVDETGWETRWRDYLSDGWLTGSVYYCFDDKFFPDNRDVIRINPALAFGTGGHGTTQGAAQLLESIVEGHNVLDVGTGSGILSILASIKGAKSVYAFDIDDVAIRNTAENISFNDIKNIKIWAGGIESFNKKCQVSVVVANIITSILKEIHNDVLEIKPEYIVYSGILQSEYDEFLSSINISGYGIEDTLSIGEWRSVRFKKISL